MEHDPGVAPADLAVRTAGVVAAQRQFAVLLRTQRQRDPRRPTPERSMLLERMEQFLAEAGLSSAHVAVVVFDLDASAARAAGLAGIDVEEGRAQLVDRLSTAARQGDVVGRAGERTVVLLCPGVPTAQVATGIAARMLALLRPAVRTALGVAVPLRVRAGVAVSEQLSTAASLLATAHAALRD